MTLQAKIITWIIVVILLIGGISYGVASYVSKTTSSQPIIPTEVPADKPVSIIQDFDSSPFTLDEGISFDLIDGWKLVSTDSERRVDRYRFERENDPTSILTFSFYSKDDVNDFDALVERRYGGAFLDENGFTEVNGLKAKRVSLRMLETGTGADYLIDLNEKEFISVYGIYQPEGEGSITLAEQLDYMQQSVMYNQTAAAAK